MPGGLVKTTREPGETFLNVFNFSAGVAWSEEDSKDSFMCRNAYGGILVDHEDPCTCSYS
eukprot:138502-Amorphochlora_amoeboformis.AAC.1